MALWTSRTTFVVLMAACVGTAGAQEPKKAGPRLTVDVYKKLKAGVGSMTADEALKLVPGAVATTSDPSTVRTFDGKTADYAIVWEDMRRIKVKFVSDKVTSVEAVFSDAVTSSHLTPALSGKILTGMSSAEVGKLLKPEKGTFFGSHSESSAGNSSTEEWSQGKTIKVLIKDGKVIDVQGSV